MVADCDGCSNVSKQFSLISKGGPSDNCPELSSFFEHLPFGWAVWITWGWGSRNDPRTQLICPECVEKAKISGEGELRISEKTILDGLAEI